MPLDASLSDLYRMQLCLRRGAVLQDPPHAGLIEGAGARSIDVEVLKRFRVRTSCVLAHSAGETCFTARRSPG